MKTSKLLLAATCIFIIAASLAACKKNVDKKSACRISALAGNGQVSHLSYNSEGQISKLVVTSGDTTTYDYVGNIITVISHSSGAFSHRYIATLNSAGLVTNLRYETNAAGTNWTNTAYEYNGEEVSRAINTYSSGGSDTTTFLWLNHNIVSDTRGTQTESWVYNTDKLRQDGDYLWIVSKFSYGADIYRTKNLVKSINSSNFSYEFDSEGKISSWGFVGSNPLVYGYECN